MDDEARVSDDHGGARRILLLLRMAWSAPLLAGLLVARRAGPVVEADTRRWYEIVAPPVSARWALLALLATHREFRTLYAYRLRRTGVVGALAAGALGVVWPGERTLHLACGDIGPGLFIQHGFATIVAARKVGANCWINQQVTIGFDRPGARPVLGDGVAVHAGAKVLGDITIGDGARIGANAVVVHDVPPGATAVGVPARILPPKGERAPS